MSNDWINIRFGVWHLQIGRDRPFPWIGWSANEYHRDRLKTGESAWFQIYMIRLPL